MKQTQNSKASGKPEYLPGDIIAPDYGKSRQAQPPQQGEPHYHGKHVEHALDEQRKQIKYGRELQAAQAALAAYEKDIR